MVDRRPTPRGGTFRRQIVLRRVDPSVVEGSVEDHIHHFTVTVEHTGLWTTAVSGQAVRAPWSVCPGATARLSELVGRAVGCVPAVPDPADHCTHLLDLALLSIRFAGVGTDRREIDVEVRGWDGPEITASARRNDGAQLRWGVVGGMITWPSTFAGRDLGAGFGAWARRFLDPDVAELAVLLRRATWMSPSADLDLDRYDRLASTPVRAASCFATQPGRLEAARRNRGASRVPFPDQHPGP